VKLAEVVQFGRKKGYTVCGFKTKSGKSHFCSVEMFLLKLKYEQKYAILNQAEWQWQPHNERAYNLNGFIEVKLYKSYPEYKRNIQ